MKILIVDDDAAIGTIFATALKHEGFNVSIALTGQDGLNKAKGELPDLILLDQVLPDISGNEILEELKKAPETKDIPVLILSNFSQGELVKEAINQGAEDYIFKYKVEPADVVAKVKRYATQS